MAFDNDEPVTPDGRSIRRMRRSRGWSRRDLVDAIAQANLRESGISRTITPNLLESIEEANERVPYGTLRHIAAGLDCNPVELLTD